MCVYYIIIMCMQRSFIPHNRQRLGYDFLNNYIISFLMTFSRRSFMWALTANISPLWSSICQQMSVVNCLISSWIAYLLVRWICCLGGNFVDKATRLLHKVPSSLWLAEIIYKHIGSNASHWLFSDVSHSLLDVVHPLKSPYGTQNIYRFTFESDS